MDQARQALEEICSGMSYDDRIAINNSLQYEEKLIWRSALSEKEKEREIIYLLQELVECVEKYLCHQKEGDEMASMMGKVSLSV